MASSSERDAAHAGPPPPDDVAIFYALIEKTVTAAALCRHARCAELAERAAKEAKGLYGENSLVVAQLRVGEAASLRSLALMARDPSEIAALRRRAWAGLVPVRALLLRRLEANTLLPGIVKEEERVFSVRTMEFNAKAKNMNEQISESDARRLADTLGYDALLDAVFQTLNLLMVLQITAP